MTQAQVRRCRLYAILDTTYVSRERWVSTCAALLAGGADLVQVRAKGESPESRAELVEAVWPLFASGQVPLIINDDVELARRFPNAGAHIGQDDLSPREARAILGPDRILGLSTHSPAQAEAALALGDTLSYFVVGPVFATPTKPDYTPVGLELVRFAAQARPNTPWFCIGGIKRPNLPEVLAAGAERVVIVSDLLTAPDVAVATRQAKDLLELGLPRGNAPQIVMK